MSMGSLPHSFICGGLPLCNSGGTVMQHYTALLCWCAMKLLLAMHDLSSLNHEYDVHWVYIPFLDYGPGALGPVLAGGWMPCVCTLYNVPALCLHSVCTVPALCLHCACTVYTVPAQCLHCLYCLQSVPCLHCVCTVFHDHIPKLLNSLKVGFSPPSPPKNLNISEWKGKWKMGAAVSGTSSCSQDRYKKGGIFCAVWAAFVLPPPMHTCRNGIGKGVGSLVWVSSEGDVLQACGRTLYWKGSLDQVGLFSTF